VCNVFVLVYGCVRARVCISMYKDICIHVRTCIYCTYTHVSLTSIYMYIHACYCVCVCMRLCVCVCMRLCLYAPVCLCLYAPVCLCLCAPVCVHVHISCYMTHICYDTRLQAHVCPTEKNSQKKTSSQTQKKQGVPCGRVAYHALLRAATSARESRDVTHQLLQTVRDSGLMPDALLYDGMLQVCFVRVLQECLSVCCRRVCACVFCICVGGGVVHRGQAGVRVVFMHSRTRGRHVASGFVCRGGKVRGMGRYPKQKCI